MKSYVTPLSIASRASLCRFGNLFVFCLLLLLATFPAHAKLKIHTVYLPGTPPANMKGGGNLEEIFQVAAERWEEVFRNGGGNWDVTIEFQWGAARHSWATAFPGAQGGNPVRMTSGLVIFQQNPPEPNFYADPTPRDNLEYEQYSSFLAGEDPVNRARIFSKPRPMSDAEGRIDLLTVATHEIGHILGLTDIYNGYLSLCGHSPACPIVVTAPRPNAGITIYSDGGHIGNSWDEHDGSLLGDPLMDGENTPGTRRLISSLDALAIAELNKFDRPDVNVPVTLPF